LAFVQEEFTAISNHKLIVDGLANLAHRPGENPRKFMARLEKLFNTLHENYASYRVKFLLTQVFRAAAQESVRKLLSHMDQTRLTVDDAYQILEQYSKRHQRRILIRRQTQTIFFCK
jgi:hypothetical protein